MSKLTDEAKREDDPLAFLRALVEGNDPRKVSKIYTTVMAVYEDNFGAPPCEEDWEEIVELVEKYGKGGKVELSVSRQAAATLAEYQHSKRKSGEGVNEEEAIMLPELTDKELKLYSRWFDAQY